MSEPPSNIENSAKLLVGSDELAGVLMVSARSIQRFGQEYGMPRAEHGRYNLVDCVHWYIQYLSSKPAADDDSITMERMLLIRAQRHRHELEIAKRRGELIEAETVAQALNQMAVIFSTQLDGLGARLASELSAIDDPGTITEKLQHECRSIRSATSAVCLDFAVSKSSGGHSKPAAKRKRRPVGRPRKNATT